MIARTPHVALSFVIAVAVACGDTGPTRLDFIEACDELCISDPTPHCISVDTSCTNSAQCASGLTCARVASDNVCGSRGDLASQCRPAPFNRLLLQTEFGVGGMPISVEPTRGIAWQAPKAAEFVACALFSCNPSFKTIGSSPTGKRELKTINNFAQCVLLFGASPASQSQFALINENIYRDPARCDTPVGGQRVVTELAAGCWAYDNTSLIAASELVHVPGTLVADLSVIPHNQQCASDGDACYDATVDRFGVCFHGACAARCISSADCVTSTMAPSTDDRCPWICQPLPGEALGACVPLE